MKVAVFGLGYVGSVSAANFAADGHDVVGVDVNPDKVAAINRGPAVSAGTRGAGVPTMMWWSSLPRAGDRC